MVLSGHSEKKFVRKLGEIMKRLKKCTKKKVDKRYSFDKFYLNSKRFFLTIPCTLALELGEIVDRP